MNNMDPKLGPLTNNGGLTATHALFPDSPAIDAGTSGTGVNTDQRGVSRPYGSAPDIGAYEWDGSLYYTSVILFPPVLSNAVCYVTAVGPTGVVIRVQKTLFFSNWVDIATTTLSNRGVLVITDSVDSFGRRFYRLSPP
jgi:hypothetical protein